MFCFSIILTALYALSEVGARVDTASYFRNVSESKIVLEEFPPDNVKSQRVIDVTDVNKARVKPLKPSLVKYLGPELIPTFWDSYSFCYYKRLLICKEININSLLIYATSNSGEQESYLFLLNFENSCLKSIVTISYDYSLSETTFGHLYSIIDGTHICLFEHRVFIDDDYVNEEPVPIPFHVKLLSRLRRLFSSNIEDYDHVFDIEIDKNGYLHTLDS